jgi:CBS domain containing-hemolysin-like protein
LHEAVFVPETINLDVLFKDMQTNHTQMVVVINEYGETSGILSMEDILEEIVGEIWDEHDEEIKEFLEVKDSIYRVLCTASVEDFFEFFELENPEEEIDASTVNGWLMEMGGNIPKEGHSVDFQNITITVTKADEFMAHEVMVEVREKEVEIDEE